MTPDGLPTMAMKSAKVAKTAKAAKVAKATGGFRPGNAPKVHHGGEFARGGGRVAGGPARTTRHKPADGQKSFDFDKPAIPEPKIESVSTVDPKPANKWGKLADRPIVKEPEARTPLADTSRLKPIDGVDPSLPAHQHWIGVRQKNNLRQATKDVEDIRGREIDPQQYLSEVNQGFSEAVKSGDHYLRIPHDSLDRVLEGGRFKSQFETNRSRGDYEEGSGHRVHSEEMRLAVPKGISKEKRPIYGYVSGKDFSLRHSSQESTLENYGEISVKLKPHVAERATVTFADSLGGEVAGVRSQAPDHTGIQPSRLWEVHQIATDKTMGGPEKLSYMLNHTQYIEAQYHGGLKAEDIAEIAFPYRIDDQTAAALKRHGIPHRVIPYPKN